MVDAHRKNTVVVHSTIVDGFFFWQDVYGVLLAHIFMGEGCCGTTWVVHGKGGGGGGGGGGGRQPLGRGGHDQLLLRTYLLGWEWHCLFCLHSCCLASFVAVGLGWVGLGWGGSVGRLVGWVGGSLVTGRWGRS